MTRSMLRERETLIRVVSADGMGGEFGTGLEGSRRQLLQWLFVVPILTAIGGPTGKPKQRSPEPDRIYIVDGWLLTESDLEELGFDAF